MFFGIDRLFAGKNGDENEYRTVSSGGHDITDFQSPIYQYKEGDFGEDTDIKDFYKLLEGMNISKNAPFTNVGELSGDWTDDREDARKALLKDLNKYHKDRGKDEIASRYKVVQQSPFFEKGRAFENKDVKEALFKGEQAVKKRELEEARKKAEERAAFLDSPKGRMQTLWEDADKRDAILGGISDAMLETRTGVDAYGSRISQAQKNVRQNLKLAEATDVARAQAALNMQKTAAETSKLLNPAQFMSSTQKEASDIASMEHVYGSPEWKTKYASEIRRIAYEDMLSGPVDAIMAINEYMFKMQGQLDPTMTEIYKDIINQLMGTIQGAAGGTGAASVRGANDIIGKTGQE